MTFSVYENNYTYLFLTFVYVSSRSLTLVPRAQCAFVQYTTRSAAEHVAEKTFNRLVIGGKRLTIKWGKSQGTLNFKYFNQYRILQLQKLFAKSYVHYL